MKKKPHYTPNCEQLSALSKWVRNIALCVSPDSVNRMLKGARIRGEPISKNN